MSLTDTAQTTVEPDEMNNIQSGRGSVGGDG